MSDVNCPYCGTGQEINHDDGMGYAEDETHQQECFNCGKTFIFTTSIMYHYYVEKAGCLNGAEHQFEETRTIPRCLRKLRCRACDEEKEIEGIEKEREEYLNTLWAKL